MSSCLTSAEQKQIVAGIMTSMPKLPAAFYVNVTQELLHAVLEGCTAAGLDCFSAHKVADYCSRDGLQELYKKLMVVVGEQSGIAERINRLTKLPLDYYWTLVGVEVIPALKKTETMFLEVRRRRRSSLMHHVFEPIIFGIT